MRVLYAIQGTGNGHLSRARAIIPLLQQRCQLDLLVSGTESEVQLPYAIKYRLKGLSFCYNRTGGLNYSRSLMANAGLHALKEVRQLPVEQYDLVINDFEPISAWACRKKGVACIAMGHQASFLSERVPRPGKQHLMGEMLLKYFAPAPQAIGFHFDTYDRFIHLPVIRNEVRERMPYEQGHYTVYLPSLGDDFLLPYLYQLPDAEWHVFSKYTWRSYRSRNIWVRPVNNNTFIRSFAGCQGLFTGGGFETPAEAMFWGKKLLVMPVKGQYEQQCNAAALEGLGIPVISRVDATFIPRIQAWLEQAQPAPRAYPDSLETIMDQVFDMAANADAQPTTDSVDLEEEFLQWPLRHAPPSVFPASGSAKS